MSGGVRDCNSCHVRVRFQSRRSTAIVEDLDAAAAAAAGGGGVYSSRSRLDGGGGGHECLAQFFDPRGMFNLFWLCIQGGPTTLGLGQTFGRDCQKSGSLVA